MEKKALTRYYSFLFLELFVVVAVIVIFRLMTDRPTAGVVAGTLFLVSTLFVLFWEWRQARRITGALIGAGLFFLGGVLPILLLRALSWGQDFEQAQLLGIPSGIWHRTSNLFFLFFLVGIFLSLQGARRSLSKKAPQS